MCGSLVINSIVIPLLFTILYFYMAPQPSPTPISIDKMDSILENWQPLPFEGSLAINSKLVHRDIAAPIKNSESITHDKDGNMYCFVDNRVLKYDGKEISEFCYTGGRPIDGEFDKNGDLLVIDVIFGLIKCHKDKKKDVSLLTNHVVVNGKKSRFNFLDALIISKDGKYVYMTDATKQRTWTNEKNEHELLKSSLLTLMKGTADGRIVVYNTETKETTLVADNLFFPNGIALDKDEESLIFCETFRVRLSRYWLKGSKKGQYELFANLPAFCDNINYSKKYGGYFVAFPALPPPIVKFLSSTMLRSLLVKLPEAIKPKPIKHGLVVVVNDNGEIIDSFHDRENSIVYTEAKEYNDKLYVTGLETDNVYSIKL